MRLERGGKTREIGILEASLVRRRGVDSVGHEQVAADGAVGAAGVVDGIADRAEVEFLAQARLHRGLAGAAGADERAVDVEKQDRHMCVLY